MTPPKYVANCCVAPVGVTVPDTPAEAGRRLHPLSPFVGIVAVDPRFAISIGALVLSGRRAWLVGMVLIVVFVWRLAEWSRTRYEVDHDRLTVSSGVANRTIRVVATDRVQQIEVVRRLRHRLFGLAALRIEFAEAGPGDRAIVLDAVSAPEAERLQALLERGRQPAGPDAAAPTAAPTARVLLRVSNARLAVGGLTGAPLLLVPAAGLTVADEFRGLGDRFDVSGLAGPALVAAVIVGLVAWALVAAGQMILRHAGLTLTQHGDEIRIARGLLERRTSVIPRRRVQLIEVSATIIRRACRLSTIDIRTAGQLELEGSGSLDNAVPIIAARDAGALVGVLLGDITPPAADRHHPAAARWASMVRRLPIAGAVAGATAIAAGPLAGIVAAAAGSAVVWVGAVRRHRSLAHGCEHAVLVACAGVLDRSSRYAPVDKVQSVAVKQGAVQRRLAIFTVSVQLAGGSAIAIRDVSAEQAARVFLDTFDRQMPGFRRTR